jgi:hypothetical protein
MGPAAAAFVSSATAADLTANAAAGFAAIVMDVVASRFVVSDIGGDQLVHVCHQLILKLTI